MEDTPETLLITSLNLLKISAIGKGPPFKSALD